MNIKRLSLICCLLLGAVDGAAAQIAGQADIGKNACGPCAVINSLLASGNAELLNQLGEVDPEERTRNFIRDYGSVASETYDDGRTVYSDEAGSTDHDLQLMLNEFLKEQGQDQVTGRYTLRNEGETVEDYVIRIHRQLNASIESGFHPLMSVRALAAEFVEEQGRFLWNSKGGHWVTVHELGEISSDGLGFSIEFSDSLSAKRLTGFFYHDPHRGSKVPMTFSVDDQGEEQWDWVSSAECMMLHAPGMPLGTAKAKWYERTIIAVRYVVLKEDSGE